MRTVVGAQVEKHFGVLTAPADKSSRNRRDQTTIDSTPNALLIE